jgi:hypothetical protein
VLRIYLQIYVEHSERLERLARSMSIARAPMLVPLQNPLIRYFSGLIFYLLLPLTMLFFVWKAAVFPAWGSGLLSVAVAVVASHLMLPLMRRTMRTTTSRTATSPRQRATATAMTTSRCSARTNRGSTGADTTCGLYPLLPLSPSLTEARWCVISIRSVSQVPRFLSLCVYQHWAGCGASAPSSGREAF